MIIMIECLTRKLLTMHNIEVRLFSSLYETTSSFSILAFLKVKNYYFLLSIMSNKDLVCCCRYVFSSLLKEWVTSL